MSKVTHSGEGETTPFSELDSQKPSKFGKDPSSKLALKGPLPSLPNMDPGGLNSLVGGSLGMPLSSGHPVWVALKGSSKNISHVLGDLLIPGVKLIVWTEKRKDFSSFLGTLFGHFAILHPGFERTVEHIHFCKTEWQTLVTTLSLSKGLPGNLKQPPFPRLCRTSGCFLQGY